MQNEKIKEILNSLFKVNMGIKSGERILVFTDFPESQRDLEPEMERKRQEIQQVAHEVAYVGHNFAEMTFYRYLETGRHGVEPPVELWEKAFGKVMVEQLKQHQLMDKILAKTLSSDEESITKKITKD